MGDGTPNQTVPAAALITLYCEIDAHHKDFRRRCYRHRKNDRVLFALLTFLTAATTICAGIAQSKLSDVITPYVGALTLIFSASATAIVTYRQRLRHSERLLHFKIAEMEMQILREMVIDTISRTSNIALTVKNGQDGRLDYSDVIAKIEKLTVAFDVILFEQILARKDTIVRKATDGWVTTMSVPMTGGADGKKSGS